MKLRFKLHAGVELAITQPSRTRLDALVDLGELRWRNAPDLGGLVFRQADGLHTLGQLNILLSNRHGCNVTIERLGSKVWFSAQGQNPRATLGSVARAASKPQYFSCPLARLHSLA